MKKRLLSFISVFFLAVFVLFGKENGEAEISFDEFFFEVTRFSISGFSTFPRAEEYASISNFPKEILSRKFFDPKKGTYLLFAEMSRSEYSKKRIGMIESSKTSEDIHKFAFAKLVKEKKNHDESYFWDWIDEVLSIISANSIQKENIRSGEEILSMMENIRSHAPSVDNGELGFFDRNGNLRKYHSGEEEFFINKNTYVNTFGNKISSYTYDNLFRLTKSEKMEMGESSKDMKKLLSKTFTYSGSSDYPSSSVEENFSKKTKINCSYGEKGLCATKDIFSYNENEKLVPQKKSKFSYDSEGRLVSEDSTEWNYTVDSKGKKKTEKIRARYELVYTELPNPNKKYYENGVLRVERVFLNEKDYDEIVHFDEGFRIVIHYEDGMKKTEIVYFGEREVRRRNLER